VRAHDQRHGIALRVEQRARQVAKRESYDRREQALPLEPLQVMRDEVLARPFASDNQTVEVRCIVFRVLEACCESAFQLVVVLVAFGHPAPKCFVLIFEKPTSSDFFWYQNGIKTVLLQKIPCCACFVVPPHCPPHPAHFTQSQTLAAASHLPLLVPLRQIPPRRQTLLVGALA
jgi:hypothetical protein